MRKCIAYWIVARITLALSSNSWYFPTPFDYVCQCSTVAIWCGSSTATLYRVSNICILRWRSCEAFHIAQTIRLILRCIPKISMSVQRDAYIYALYNCDKCPWTLCSLWWRISSQSDTSNHSLWSIVASQVRIDVNNAASTLLSSDL